MADPKIIHFEVTGRDQVALQKYYGDLFGWTINTDNPGGYGMSGASPTGVVVGVGADQTGGAGWVTFYVRVDSIDATLARAVELGGSVVTPRFSPDGSSYLGLVADPEGHVLGLSE